MATQRQHKGRELTGIAVRIIAQNGGNMGRAELLDALTPEAHSRFPDYAKEEYVHGYPKWVGQLDTFSSRHAKYIIGKESRGEWFLTEEGMRMTRSEDGKGECLSEEEIAQNYEKWLDGEWLDGGAHDASDESAQEGDDEVDDEPSQEQLKDGIANYILKRERDPKNTGVWFEELVVALLRGMGYQYVDKRGKSGDGGVDIVAYKDKLGATLPRIKVQAKHNKGEKPQPVQEQVLQRLASIVHPGEIGMCVTSSSFSKNAEIYARTCDKHLELVDVKRLVVLWTEHYPFMTEADQNKLPLKYWLDMNKIREMSDASN